MGLEDNFFENPGPSRGKDLSEPQESLISVDAPEREVEGGLSLHFDERGNLSHSDSGTASKGPDSRQSGIYSEAGSFQNEDFFDDEKVLTEAVPGGTEQTELAALEQSPLVNETVATNENQDELYKQFEQAAKLGRSLFNESRQRTDGALAAYLDPRGFNDEDVKALGKQELLSPESVAEAERASLALALQSADQITQARLPQQQSEHVLKRRTLEVEIDSLGKVDGMLGAGFRKAQSWIREGRASEVVQEARKVIARSQKISPDKITASDKQILEWVQNTIHAAGRRVRQHRTKGTQLLRGGR
ncbi:MAG: hypothetical protein WD200_02750 [Candidatus Andersenbacteria bacterium]